MKQIIKHVAQEFYRIPFFGETFRQLVESTRGASPHETPEYWNTSLKGWAASYLGGTLSVDLRDSITLQLATHCAPSAKTILDMGCGGATLGLRLGPEFHTYWGVDISHVAIAKAKEHLSGRKANPSLKYNLEVSRVQDYQPSRQFDVIVFNEVLYYIPLSQVAGVIECFKQALSPGGRFVISLKNDSISRLVNGVVSRKLKFEHAVLSQQMPVKPGWKTVENRQTPAYLIQAFSKAS